MADVSMDVERRRAFAGAQDHPQLLKEVFTGVDPMSRKR
jgi:hypothetical protein